MLTSLDSFQRAVKGQIVNWLQPGVTPSWAPDRYLQWVLASDEEAPLSGPATGEIISDVPEPPESPEGSFHLHCGPCTSGHPVAFPRSSCAGAASARALPGPPF